MPTPEMRQAMATAPLGDDVFGDDPMVNELEQVAASMLGKEAAMFLPSGTMGNVVGVAVNTRPGEEMIADADAHVFLYEAAGAAVIAGVQIRPVATAAGVMTPSQIEAALRPRDDFHQPITAAVSFEDTHNRHGGVVWPLENLRAAADAARGHGLRVHLDGARIFVFCGSAESVQEARRWRKRLGGAMRQAGVIAATGLIALRTMVDRLAEDHANARTLAEGLAELPGVQCDLSRVQTNLVFFDLERMTGADFEAECAKRGLLGGATGAHRIRFVTHYGITPDDIQSTLKICDEVLSA